MHATCIQGAFHSPGGEDPGANQREAKMQDPKFVMILAVGTLLVVSGIFDWGRRRRGGGDGGL